MFLIVFSIYDKACNASACHFNCVRVAFFTCSVIGLITRNNFFFPNILCCRCMIELKCLLYAIPRTITEDQHMLVQLIGCQVKNLAFLMPNVLRTSAYLFWYLTILFLVKKITDGFTLASYASSTLKLK